MPRKLGACAACSQVLCQRSCHTAGSSGCNGPAALHPYNVVCFPREVSLAVQCRSGAVTRALPVCCFGVICIERVPLCLAGGAL
jgi:hypothetical protein